MHVNLKCIYIIQKRIMTGIVNEDKLIW